MGGKSEVWQDILFEVLQCLFRTRQLGILVNFLWVPDHVVVDGNEEVDPLVKKALNHPQIEINLSLGKTEIKRLIASMKWQKKWNCGSKGRHLYQIQDCVGNERKRYGNRKKDVIILMWSTGHTAFNCSVYEIGKHEKHEIVTNVETHKQCSMLFLNVLLMMETSVNSRIRMAGNC